MSIKKALTIQIFLPDGDPFGLRVATETTHVCQVIEIPRLKLPEFANTEESHRVGVYVLMEPGDIDDPLSIYVGQTSDLATRLQQHNSQKDFWDRAFAIVSRVNALTQAHSQFLEWMAIQAAKKANRYKLKNANDGTRSHLTASIQAECESIFSLSSLLFSVLGCRAFEPILAHVEKDQQCFYCSRLSYRGVAHWTNEGMVICAGSKGPSKLTPTCPKGVIKERAKLLNSGIITDNGTCIEFQKEHIAKSPSAAAAVIQGRSANGWTEWKTKEGKSLDNTIRNRG